MPTTPNYGYPYPTLDDPPNVPADLQELAEAIDADLKADRDARRVPLLFTGTGTQALSGTTVYIAVSASIPAGLWLVEGFVVCNLSTGQVGMITTAPHVDAVSLAQLSTLAHAITGGNHWPCISTGPHSVTGPCTFDVRVNGYAGSTGTLQLYGSRSRIMATPA
jgi:hypothetical protein